MIKGYLIPVTAPSDSLRLIEAPSFKELCKIAGIEYAEIVHGANSPKGNFVAVVDEDGISKRMEVNFAASNISGYPGFMYGPCIILAEYWDNDSLGMDLKSLDDAQFRTWCGGNLSLTYHFH